MWLKFKIFPLIYQNGENVLKDMKIQFRDINYLEEFKDIHVDDFISPLHLTLFTGKVEIMKIITWK